MERTHNFDRRALLWSLGCATALSVALPRMAHAQIHEPMAPMPTPQQAPAKKGVAAIGNTHLWYWDTGGPGEPIVLLHPGSGSALGWEYQQPAFAKAGYRVIAYSRRGYNGSDPVPKENPGSAAGDLHDFIQHLGLKKFHLVASAAGGRFAIHYALAHPERLHTIVLADSVGGVEDDDSTAMQESLSVKGLDDLPVEFRELGPSYRAINPEGMRRFAALSKIAVTGNRFGQTVPVKITWASMESIQVPTLLMTGDADLSIPPSLMRLYARHIPNNEIVIVPEAGHSIYWERPDVFNAAVLTFLAKHNK